MILGMDTETRHWARRAGERLRVAGLCLATAESCTGGGVAHALTMIAGSSDWFERGFVTYANLAKEEMLGVRAETLATYGAVSEATVREMAEGALARSHAGVSLAVSGIAGPAGGSADKPVGTVWFAWAATGRPTRTRHCRFEGDRDAVRQQAVIMALRGVLDYLDAGAG